LFKKKIIYQRVYAELFWFNDNIIVGLCFYEFIRFVIDDSEYKKEKIFVHNRPNYFYHLHIMGNSIVSIEQEDVIVIEGINFKIIPNNFKIVNYYNYYDVFLDDMMQLYKLVNDNFVRFKFEYNFWCYDDKPECIQHIVDVLIDFDLFPIEICNIVFQEVVILFFENSN